jgi:hypothetical protein
MFKGFGKPKTIRKPNPKQALYHLMDMDEAWELMNRYEADESNDTEFRCLASVVVRVPLVESLLKYEAIDAQPVLMCIMSYCTCYGIEIPNATAQDRQNFAAFREAVRRHILPKYHDLRPPSIF